jgi:predicted nucleic acid-binding protein
LRNIYKKLKESQKIEESDIRSIIEATEGTNIRIFPRDESKSGSTIQYVFVDKFNNRE